MRLNLSEVYRDSGLGKWFHGESATKEPGWDRYNSEGKRVGKCGDAKEGSSYSACLSKQKAAKLGKEGVGNFVKRKRAAQSKRGRGKKGVGKKGKKPIFVKTGASKKMNENYNLQEARKKINLRHSSIAARKLAAHHGVNDPKQISKMASQLKTAAHHEGLDTRISRFAKTGGNTPQDSASLLATLSKRVGLPHDPAAHKAGHPEVKKTPGWIRVPSETSESKPSNEQPSLFDLSEENCGCDESPAKKLLKRTKEKYMKENVSRWIPKHNINVKEVPDFTQLNLNEYINKSVLLETDTGTYSGKLVLIKENCAITKNDKIEKIFDQTDILKLVCENEKIIITEGKNTPNDSGAWSDCKSQAKKKFDVYPSAYANAWAAKCYKKKGGSWSKVNEDFDPNKELVDPAKNLKLTESQDLLLKEKIKHMFFKEDIVNPDNIGKLTPQKSNPRAKSRDKIREKVKDRAKVVTGPKDKNGNKLRDDTPEEASYRLATYIELKEKGPKEEKKSENSSKKKKKSTSKSKK